VYRRLLGETHGILERRVGALREQGSPLWSRTGLGKPIARVRSVLDQCYML
jgi:hypothetical protein